MSEKILALQEQVIGQLSALAPSGWRRLFLNYEMQDEQSTVVSDYVFFAITKTLLGKVSRTNIRLTINERRSLNEIGQQLMLEAGQKHLTMDVLVRDDGTFKAFLDYDQPARIGGDLTATKRHLKYIAEEKLLGQVD